MLGYFKPTQNPIILRELFLKTITFSTVLWLSLTVLWILTFPGFDRGWPKTFRILYNAQLYSAYIATAGETEKHRKFVIGFAVSAPIECDINFVLPRLYLTSTECNLYLLTWPYTHQKLNDFFCFCILLPLHNILFILRSSICGRGTSILAYIFNADWSFCKFHYQIL